MSLQKEYESYLAHVGVKGMKWGQRKEYEAHPRKPSRKEKKELRKAKKVAKRKKILKTGAILGGAAAVTVGTIVGINLLKKKQQNDFHNLEKKARLLNAQGEMDNFIRGIPKAKSDLIYKQQRDIVKNVWNKKVSDINNDVSKLSYSGKRMKELKTWNKNYENAQTFLRGLGIS